MKYTVEFEGTAVVNAEDEFVAEDIVLGWIHNDEGGYLGLASDMDISVIIKDVKEDGAA